MVLNDENMELCRKKNEFFLIDTNVDYLMHIDSASNVEKFYRESVSRLKSEMKIFNNVVEFTAGLVDQLKKTFIGSSEEFRKEMEKIDNNGEFLFNEYKRNEANRLSQYVEKMDKINDAAYYKIVFMCYSNDTVIKGYIEDIDSFKELYNDFAKYMCQGNAFSVDTITRFSKFVSFTQRQKTDLVRFGVAPDEKIDNACDIDEY